MNQKQVRKTLDMISKLFIDEDLDVMEIQCCVAELFFTHCIARTMLFLDGEGKKK